MGQACAGGAGVFILDYIPPFVEFWLGTGGRILLLWQAYTLNGFKRNTNLNSHLLDKLSYSFSCVAN